jgi:hypothetical protein
VRLFLWGLSGDIGCAFDVMSEENKSQFIDSYIQVYLLLLQYYLH